MPRKPTPNHPAARPTQPTPAVPPVQPESATDHWAADSLRHRATLNRVIDMGAAIAEKIFQQVTAETQAAGAARAPDPTIPFERVTRVIRYTIGLARKVAEPLPAASAEPARERTKARDQIIRKTEDVIFEHFAGNPAENFRDDLFCRLEDPEFERKIGKRPIPELVTELCHDLGLVVNPGPEPWRYMPDEALDRLFTRAAVPRSTPPPARTNPWDGTQKAEPEEEDESG